MKVNIMAIKTKEELLKRAHVQTRRSADALSHVWESAKSPPVVAERKEGEATEPSVREWNAILRQLREATAAVTELANRRAGLLPPREGDQAEPEPIGGWEP